LTQNFASIVHAVDHIGIKTASESSHRLQLVPPNGCRHGRPLTPPIPRLVDQLRNGQAYLDWIRRFIEFDGKRHAIDKFAALAGKTVMIGTAFIRRRRDI
jgi:hypothetical protein